MKHIKYPKVGTYYLVYALFGSGFKEAFTAQYTEDGEWSVITGVAKSRGKDKIPMEPEKISTDEADVIFKLSKSEILLNVLAECV